MARFLTVTWYPEQAQVKKILWELSKACRPQDNCADYTQAIMDLGATCCTTKNRASLSGWVISTGLVNPVAKVSRAIVCAHAIWQQNATAQSNTVFIVACLSCYV